MHMFELNLGNMEVIRNTSFLCIDIINYLKFKRNFLGFSLKALLNIIIIRIDQIGLNIIIIIKKIKGHMTLKITGNHLVFTLFHESLLRNRNDF